MSDELGTMERLGKKHGCTQRNITAQRSRDQALASREISRARREKRGRNAGEVVAEPDEEHAASTKGERGREPLGTSARRRDNVRAWNRGDEREMGTPLEQRRELHELEGAGGPRLELATRGAASSSRGIAGEQRGTPSREQSAPWQGELEGREAATRRSSTAGG